MEYLVQIYTGDALDSWQERPEAERAAITAEYMALNGDPVVRGGAQLQDPGTATTVQVKDGSTLTTDGPFAETKEALGGYYLIDAPDLDAAIDFAARVPAARLGGAVEVRPLVQR